MSSESSSKPDVFFRAVSIIYRVMGAGALAGGLYFGTEALHEAGEANVFVDQSTTFSERHPAAVDGLKSGGLLLITGCLFNLGQLADSQSKE